MDAGEDVPELVALHGGEVVRAEDTAERGAMRAVRVTREIAGGKTGKEQVGFSGAAGGAARARG